MLSTYDDIIAQQKRRTLRTIPVLTHRAVPKAIAAIEDTCALTIGTGPMRRGVERVCVNDPLRAHVTSRQVLGVVQFKPGATCRDVSATLNIPGSDASGRLASLHKQGLLTREGEGSRGNPYRYTVR